MGDSDVVRRVDAEIVDMLWNELEGIYGTRRKRKRDSFLMKAVAFVFSIFRVMPKDRFLDRFATTFGRTIYLPDHGDGVRNLMWEAATCVHEHDHVRSWGFLFMARYVFSPSWRAFYEARAYCTNIALRYWYAGDWLDIKKLAGNLQQNYSCRRSDVEMAYRFFEEERDALRIGCITNPVVSQALSVFRRHGVRPDDVWIGKE
jgi:hypothetical protein